MNPPLSATVESVLTWARQTFDRELKRIGSSAAGEPLWGVRFGHGPRHALLLAWPTGLDALAATALPSIVSALQQTPLGYRWSVVMCCDPDGATFNEMPHRASETLEFALSGLYHAPRPRRVDWGLASQEGVAEANAILAWAPPADIDLVVALRTRLVGGVSVPGASPERVREAGLAWSTPLFDTAKPGSRYRRWIDSVWPRFTHPRLDLTTESRWRVGDLARDLVTETTQANETWTDDFLSIRPYLIRDNPYRPWLDEFDGSLSNRMDMMQRLEDDDRPLTEGTLFETRTRVSMWHVRAAAQLLRAVKWELEKGHTVPALMGAIRPLNRRVGLCPEGQPVAPLQLQSVMTELVLQAVAAH